MRTIRNRVEQLETEFRFRKWLAGARLLERFTAEQLLDFAAHKTIPESIPPPLPSGESESDGLDKRTLMKLWKENERIGREFMRHTEEERLFWTQHGHFPDARTLGPNSDLRSSVVSIRLITSLLLIPSQYSVTVRGPKSQDVISIGGKLTNTATGSLNLDSLSFMVQGPTWAPLRMPERFRLAPTKTW